MKKTNRSLTVFLLVIVTIIFSTFIAFANSAETPGLVILVNNPPDDLSVTMVSDSGETLAVSRKTAWEGYYLFYKSDLQYFGEYRFKVTSEKYNFECSFNQPLKKYTEILTLDLPTQELSYGKYPLRSVLLVGIRLILTLLIEGAVFFIFGFREKRTWMVFLIVNLFTQGVLNWWLNSDTLFLSSAVFYALIFGEIFVFITESIILPITIKEKSGWKVLGCTLLANIASLFIGGYLIINLPF